METDLPDLPLYGFRPDLGGLLGLAITVVLPILVALLTRQSWKASVKGVVLLFLAAVKVVLETALQAHNTGVPFDAYGVIYTTLINFGIAVAAYVGFLKDTSMIKTAQRSLVKDKTTDGRYA